MKSFVIAYITFVLILATIISVNMSSTYTDNILLKVKSNDYFILENTVFKCREYFKGEKR